ncbi:hypothetical protein EV363DRAFT_1298025 [Boletus edulis]|nr:hypothetical protein EV363DRAFT_1306545 [Boletus edulis]KAF8119867.1 hypothetical protein EV363DRAFT_1460841 [Boletus edulis]KAF8119868.1 hypothetical protein EV363DRAFT_1460847 [Boletus edulis]KAF8127558.1 hypothetical protein EV363DRAFT_1298025 [Boletus edulis]
MSANVARLNAAVLAVEQLERSFSEYKDKAEKQVQLLYQENKLLKAENAHLKDEQKDILERLSRIESHLGFVYVDGEDPGVTIQDGSSGPKITEPGSVAGSMDESGRVPTTTVAKVDEDPKLKASADALKSKIFKDLMTKSFKILLGVQKLDANHLPGYPMGIGEDTDAWPKDAATGKPLLRFDWRLGKHDDSANTTALKKVVEHIQMTGNQMSTVTNTTLAQILPGEIEKAVRAKYMRMAAEFRKADKKRKRDEEDDLESEVEVVDVALDRAHMNSRVQSKLDARKRKRLSNECPPQWKDAKYDTAFILNAMSDDEDDPNHITGQPRAYVTKEPEWRHLQLSELFSAIDALKDPRPDQAKLAKTRIRSTDKKLGPPPLARTLATRVRTWMIKPELLQKNPDWLTTGRVATSGEAWGEEAPKELEKDRKGKGKAIEGDSKRIIFRRKIGEDGSSKYVVETARSKIGEILGERETADDLFD